MAPKADVIANYLAATDSRDKLIKGAGCFFKVLAATTGEANYLSVANSMSDCRSLMRMLSWLNNVQVLSEATEKNVVQFRDVIHALRVLCDGVFSLLDNVVYLGRFFQPKNPQLAQLSFVSRAALFYGYVFACTLDVYDLTYDKNLPDRHGRFLVLTRNVCDLVSCVGNVSKVDIGAANSAMLGLISSIIASRELYRKACKTISYRSSEVGSVSK